MDLWTILDLSTAGFPDRPVVGAVGERPLTCRELRGMARSRAQRLLDAGVECVVYVGENGPAFPVALFAASAAGVPFLPLNYRWSVEQLSRAIRSRGRVAVISDQRELHAGDHVVLAQTMSDWFGSMDLDEGDAPIGRPVSPDDVAVLLMTSGTTSEPKSAVLRHRNLTSYVVQSVEFAGADEDETALVSVPPYHIASVANLLSNLFAGRRIAYLTSFSAEGWLNALETERVTHAMVVPTMLARIVAIIGSGEAPGFARLRSLAYGGAKVSSATIEAALEAMPEVSFVNAYGLTETASTIAVLGPEDHRIAAASRDPAVRARLGSVGRPLPSVEIEVRDDDGPCAPLEKGEIFVRGGQVSGEYLGSDAAPAADGWFPTRDEGYFDEDGFLFVTGRADDTIIRGGENVAPAEIEAPLNEHPAVLDVAVAGVPDEEWGHTVAAFIVTVPAAELTPAEVKEWVRARLRSSRTPDHVVFLPALPYGPTGKLLRRELVADLVSTLQGERP